MLVRWKSGHASWSLIAVTMFVLLAHGCRNRVPPGDGDSSTEAVGEPEQYSATVVRVVEDGPRRETNISREARAGEQRREEWNQNGQNRALIWRPDLGKAFLLDMDGRAYVEIAINRELSESQPRGNDGLPRARQARERDLDDDAFQQIDRLIEQPLSPTSVDTRMVRDEKIEGFICRVSERRAVFADGHIEVTRVFRARDLGGLALRVELEGAGNQRVITERRDVRTEVSPEAFVVPSDFKKVDKLEH
jgi:hypothetical protein